jgi:hypothetical protein
MHSIRNRIGKLVCKADPASYTVEIIQKGYKTIIRFRSDGTIEVVNF